MIMCQVIFDVSLEVNEGELVSIVGSHGAGKTTILRAISGLIRPFSGEIEFEGSASMLCLLIK